jgi:hypothetical protein
VIGVRYEGLREVAQALRATQIELYSALEAGLTKSGDIVRDDARQMFIQWGTGGVARSASRGAGIAKAAEGFKTLFRPNTSTMSIVSVAQTLRRSKDMHRRRSNFGDLMMRKALLPARNQDMAKVVAVLETEVGALLHEHGF